MVTFEKLSKTDPWWVVIKNGRQVDTLCRVISDPEKWRLWKNTENFTSGERDAIKEKLDELNSK